MWEAIALSVLAAILYSLTMYFKKHVNPDNPQSFDPAKFITTLIWGAIIGAYLAYTGNPVTEQSIQAQMALYAGFIAITENIIKGIIRKVKG